MNHRLEQYLSRATRGLYGAKKLEIQAELRGNIEARIWQLEMQGNTNALETALSEMGAATTINAGLFKEHAMPNISKAVFVAIAATALTIAGISSSQAQVSWATAKDEYLKDSSFHDIFININDLKISFEKAGATVSESMAEPNTYTNRGLIFNLTPIRSWDETLPVRTFDIQLPSSEQKIRLQALAKYSLNPEEKIATTPEEAAFISYNYIIDQFKVTKLPVRFEGWQTPKIHVGDFSFTLEKAGSSLQPDIQYLQIFINWWAFGDGRPGIRNQLSISFSGSIGASGAYRHAIRTNQPANTVYAIVSSDGGFRSAAGEDEPRTNLTLARTNANGILEFTTPYRILQFGKNPLLEKKVASGVGSEKNPAQALLIQFTGRIDDMAKSVEIVLPNKTKIAALK